jgi:hypothetical protein
MKGEGKFVIFQSRLQRLGTVVDCVWVRPSNFSLSGRRRPVRVYIPVKRLACDAQLGAQVADPDPGLAYRSLREPGRFIHRGVCQAQPDRDSQ